jgi:hypothetical protein
VNRSARFMATRTIQMPATKINSSALPVRLELHCAGSQRRVRCASRTPHPANPGISSEEERE